MAALHGNAALERMAAILFNHENIRELANMNQEGFMDAMIETLRYSGVFINTTSDTPPRLCFWRQWNQVAHGGVNAYNFSQTTSSAITDAYVHPDVIQLPYFSFDDDIFAERVITENTPSPVSSSNGTDDMSVESESDNIDDSSDYSDSNHYEPTYSTTNRRIATESTSIMPTATESTSIMPTATGSTCSIAGPISIVDGLG